MVERAYQRKCVSALVRNQGRIYCHKTWRLVSCSRFSNHNSDRTLHLNIEMRFYLLLMC